MKYDWTLTRAADGALFLRTHGKKGASRPMSVCTVLEAMRMLRRSRRQVYRYIQAGVLNPRGSVLDTWLLDPDEVRRIAVVPHPARRPPFRFQYLFPEYRIRDLHPLRDWRTILSRILDRGGRTEIRWALRHYPLSFFRDFLRHDGWRLLSPRSLRFWSLYAGVRPETPRWRREGPRWGGVA